MSIPKYQDVVRKPNILAELNPLKKTTAKVISLEFRVRELTSWKDWQKLVQKYYDQGLILDPKLRPLVKMVKLGRLLIDEDIQRALDKKHCKKIAMPDIFNPSLLQVVFCVKTPNVEEYHAVDGQHTATLLAALVDAGLFALETDWKEVEVPVLYIETTSKAFARKAFALINGKGKKKISAYYEHRTKVMARRIDDSDDEDDKNAERKQQICEKHNCYPVDDEGPYVNKPGTFTHMQALNLPDEILELACKFHDKYFHNDPIDGSLWFMMADLYRAFKAAKINITDEFLEELAGIIQIYFAGLYQFHESVHSAHKRWGKHYYGYDEFPWSDDAIACVLVSLYDKLGGKQKIPQMLLDRFDKIIDFVNDDIKDFFQKAA